MPREPESQYHRDDGRYVRHSRRSRSRSIDKRSRKDFNSRERKPRLSPPSRGGSLERTKRRNRSVSSLSESSARVPEHKREKRKRKRSRSGERPSKKRSKKNRKGKEKKESANLVHWGKYGIIADTDIFRKDQEFRTWLVEERKINPETISKDKEKKEFAQFVEDYNTATLPHEKYYDMEEYDRRMSAVRHGDYLPVEASYDFNADMKAVSNAHKKKAVEQDVHLTKEEVMELRKVQQERNEIGRMKLLGMDVKQNFGVRMDTSYEQP